MIQPAPDVLILFAILAMVFWKGFSTNLPLTSCAILFPLVRANAPCWARGQTVSNVTRTGNARVREMSLVRTAIVVWMVILLWKRTTRMDVDSVSVMVTRRTVSRPEDTPASTSHLSSVLAPRNGGL